MTTCPSPASVPTEEDVARLLVSAHASLATPQNTARAVLDLFAPILAERENLACNLDAIQSDHADTLAMLIEANAERREFKARALSAEAALASARESDARRG